MPYIVDGNNVMGQTPGWHRDKPNARKILLKKAAAFARVKATRVTVVFDGAPDRGMPEGSAFRGVKVLYAERGSDADARIERLVENSLDPTRSHCCYLGPPSLISGSVERRNGRQLRTIQKAD